MLVHRFAETIPVPTQARTAWAAREFPAAAAARSAPPIRKHESQAPCRKAHPTGTHAKISHPGKSNHRCDSQSAVSPNQSGSGKETRSLPQRTGSVTGEGNENRGLSNQKLQAGNFVKRSRIAPPDFSAVHWQTSAENTSDKSAVSVAACSLFVDEPADRRKLSARECRCSQNVAIFIAAVSQLRCNVPEPEQCLLFNAVVYAAS